MASDGNQPVGWYGNAFSYLLHHPKDPSQTASYAQARQGGGGSNHSEEKAPPRDRTGVWSGPAPRGYVANPTHAADEPASSSRTTTVNEPSSVVLPGGARMPLLGLGTYRQSSADAVLAALEMGYRHLDCATQYDNEAIIGQALSRFLAASPDAAALRSQLWVTSKVWNDAHRPDVLRASVVKSIADLECGHLDLLLVHWPHAWQPGTESPDASVTLKDTWAEMEALVDEGLVRHLGVSNFSLAQVEDVLGWARVKPAVLQIELHPLLSQRKLVGVCARKGVACVAYSPLGHSGTALLEHPEVVRVAAEAGRTPAQVLLRWGVQRGTAVIPKAGSEPHARENIEGLFGWRLSWSHKAALDALNEGKRFVNTEWHQWAADEEGGAVKPSTVLL